MSKRFFGIKVIVLLAFVFVGEQRVLAFNDDISANGCSMAVGGDLAQSDVDIICGIPRDVYEKLINRYENSLSDKDEILGLLREKLRLNERQIAAAFEAAGREGVPPERMGETLLEIAQKYKSLQEELQETSGDSTEIRQKKALAAKALEEGDLDRADALLDKIIALEDAAIDQRALEAAATRAKKAEVALLRLRYRDAADVYAAAAKRVPATHSAQQHVYLRLQAKVLYDDGKEFGRNESLQQAIKIYQELLSEVDRIEDPDGWVSTQGNLGTALQILGAREPGTARLEEAAAAYRAALEELTRDRDPLDWAATQNNLGNALATIGAREPGTARLDEAVAAYRAALEEWTRDRDPLLWATTQNNLGNALGTIGVQEPGTARLEEAVAAFRSALEERTRDRDPLGWATTQNNLGNALGAIGAREPSTARLEEAVAAYRAALEERTRERFPLDWAFTQNNLGVALHALGAREPGTVRLEGAVTAFRAALEELTRDRVPLYRAGTQNDLGKALLELGKRTQDAALMHQAKAAFEYSSQAFSDTYGDRYESYFANALAVVDQLIAEFVQ
jgi:tetratricopeptide (TPR) repeat protein